MLCARPLHTAPGLRFKDTILASETQVPITQVVVEIARIVRDAWLVVGDTLPLFVGIEPHRFH